MGLIKRMPTPGEVIHHGVNGLLGFSLMILVILTLYYYFLGAPKRFKERAEWEVWLADHNQKFKKRVHATRHAQRAQILKDITSNYY